MSGIRRFAGAAAVVLGAAGLTTVVAPAANAAPTCFPIYEIFHDTTPSNSISSSADMYCEDGTSYLLTARIEKYNPATGTWAVVASDLGYTTYACNGTATRTYRTGEGRRHRSITAACG